MSETTATFIMSSSRAILPVIGGALAAGVLAAALIEMVRRLGRVEPGAAMGVVFSIMFALGVVLIEQVGAHNINLTTDCVLYGQIEDILWLAPNSWASLTEPVVWADMPREVITLLVVFLLCGSMIVALYKELKITSFDPDLATTLGISSRLIHYGLMTMVAIACVAAFEAVGSILVIAMLIIPAAIARLLTDQLSVQIWLSLLAALLIGPGGYVLAAFGPFWVGGSDSLNAAGMMAVLAGVLLVIAIVLAPHYGMIAGGRRLRAALASR